MDVTNPNGEQPADAKVDQRKVDFFSSLTSFVGKDIQSLVSVPIFIMEPFTTLQKMAEIAEYNDLLDLAASTEDPAMRLAWITTFYITQYAATERTYKPFNPVLGETFEWHDLKKDVHLMAEQVSHHPPVGALHIEAPAWTYDIVSAPTTRFLGNSIEIFPENRSRITLKGSGEQYYVTVPTVKAHNIIIGFTWIDIYGSAAVGSTESGWVAKLEFKPCGWLGQGRYEVSGAILDPQGTKRMLLRAKWNERVEVAPCNEAGEAAGPFQSLWSVRKKPDDPYGFTSFALSLNRAEGYVPRGSDSRRRPDRHLLEMAENGAAQSAKAFVEEQQRKERRIREEKGDAWAPTWFRLAERTEQQPGEPDPAKFPQWEWKGEAATPVEGGGSAVGGAEFNPWQYPAEHLPLHFEAK